MSSSESAQFETLTYERTGRIARITLNRPQRGNGITFEMPRELAAAVEHANLDPNVHVIALAGNGKGFCGGYDLVASAEGMLDGGLGDGASPAGSPMDPMVQAANHVPGDTWDPVIDYQMMSRNVRGFMSLFHGDKPVVCKVHGFCVAGGTDMALCSDLLVIAEDAKIGYPPARVWGVPTTMVWVHRIGIEKAKRLLFTGDSLSGREAHEWGLAIEAPPAAELDERFELLLERIARMPVNQLVMMKLLVNQTVMQQGLHTTQVLGTVFDGVARHTREGYAFQQRAAEAGFKQAVRERDEPFGDFGPSTFKGSAPKRRPVMTSATLHPTIAGYFDALSRMDFAGVGNCFAPDGVQEDPVGGEVRRGPAAVATALGQLGALFAALDIRATQVFPSGNETAVVWEAKGRGKNGVGVRFEGIDVVTIDANGKIASLRGYWDPMPIVAQLMPA